MFCSNKLSPRIDKHYSAFLAIQAPEILEFQKTIEGLAKMMRRRQILYDEDWELTWSGLSNLQVETAEMFRENPDLCELLAINFPTQQFLEKL